MGELSKLKGLGPKSEQWLNEVGITTKEQLQELGAVNAFLRLRAECSTSPSLNFLYALVGAIEDRPWLEIAREERTRLIFALEEYEQHSELLRSIPSE